MKSIKDKLKNKEVKQENFRDEKKVIEELSKKNESELMAELLSVANQKRNDGSLDNATLDSFKEKISPSLTDEQQQKLNNIINMLKK